MIRINLGRGIDITGYGVGLGGALAMILSYSINKSILWAALHGLCEDVGKELGLLTCQVKMLVAAGRGCAP